MQLIENINFVNIIEFLGTFAFAISGIRLASAKKFDWFGAFVIGFVTAIGGGTVRDLLLDVIPFWMQTPIYLWCTLFALLFVLAFHRYLIHLNNTFFVFDSIGLGLFVVVGVEKTLALGFPSWVAIVMGAITGAVGGVMRDVLINEIPLIFRKEIYALVCILGGSCFIMLRWLGIPPIFNEISTAIIVILARYIVVKYHLRLPILKGEN